MKLGFVSAILDGWTFEEMIEMERNGLFLRGSRLLGPPGKAERRYAGVSHIDAGDVLEPPAGRT